MKAQFNVKSIKDKSRLLWLLVNVTKPLLAITVKLRLKTKNQNCQDEVKDWFIKSPAAEHSRWLA